jgi:hypothetical protein
MANAWYSRWSDNVLRKVTPTMPVGALLSSNFPLTHLVDEAPASLCRLSGTTCRFVWDKGIATKIDWALIGQHNLDAGLSGVLFQGHTSDAWTSPALSAAFTIPGADADGFRINPRLDLTGISSRTFRYWSMTVSVANSSALSFGEIMAFGTKRVQTPNVSWEVETQEERAVVHMATKAGAGGAYDEGVWQRELTGEVDCSDAEAAELRTWYRDARGTARIFAYVPDGDVNDAWIVKFGMPLRRRWSFLDRNIFPFRLVEAARGINVE